MRSLFVFCLSVIFLDACIDPFDIELSALDARLTVEGMITDQPGPYTVKIFRAAALDNQLDQTNWVTKAAVTIYDDTGFSETLKEISPGNYQTAVDGIQGVAGRTYFIKIITSQEEIYESQPEKLLPVGEIRSVYFEFKQNADPADEDFLNPQNGFNIYVDAEVLPEQENLVRWRTTGTFEIKTFPEKRKVYISLKGGGTALIPDPPACSGWTYSDKKGLVQTNSGCSCCDCWITEYGETPRLSDVKFVNNGSIRKYPIGFIPASRRLFYNKYHLQVEQMSISKIVYTFWEYIKKQKEAGSDLFQTPPPETRGNVIAKTPGATQALGFFAAASVKTTTLFIERGQIPYTMPPIDTLAVSCREPYRYSTNVKPLFW